MLPVLGRCEISKLEPERATKLNAAQACRKTKQKLSAGRGSSLRQGTEQERAVQQLRAVLCAPFSSAFIGWSSYPEGCSCEAKLGAAACAELCCLGRLAGPVCLLGVFCDSMATGPRSVAYEELAVVGLIALLCLFLA